MKCGVTSWLLRLLVCSGMSARHLWCSHQPKRMTQRDKTGARGWGRSRWQRPRVPYTELCSMAECSRTVCRRGEVQMSVCRVEEAGDSNCTCNRRLLPYRDCLGKSCRKQTEKAGRHVTLRLLYNSSFLNIDHLTSSLHKPLLHTLALCRTDRSYMRLGTYYIDRRVIVQRPVVCLFLRSVQRSHGRPAYPRRPFVGTFLQQIHSYSTLRVQSGEKLLAYCPPHACCCSVDAWVADSHTT